MSTCKQLTLTLPAIPNRLKRQNSHLTSPPSFSSAFPGELLLYYMNAMLSTYSHFVFDSEFMGR